MENNFESIKKDYKKYKWFFTSKGKLAVGGKNAEQNEELLTSLLNIREKLFLMHTTEPGSPFSAILSPIEKISKDEIRECAVFTASFSQAWKKGKSKAPVDIFKSSQLHKDKKMKTGTWGVSGQVERIVVPLELALTKQRGVLRAVPLLAIKNKKSIIFKILPGNIDKLDLASKISEEKSIDKEQLLSALPAGGIKIQNE